MSFKRRNLRIVLIVASFLFCLQIVAAQEVELGKITDNVTITAHPDQSYALFLPTNYTADKAWPTIFCFDPRGRGKVAIERFAEAAERFGYVVACSNNSRNGLNWSIVADIFSNFWDDVHSRLHVDDKRTFAAGFSGGSRLATTFASRCRGCLAGVIACGAGFPGDIAPDAKITFAYYGIVGVDDFNFGEMWQLEKKLSKLSAPYRFETFSGGHEWAPKESLQRALAWLNLQSIKAGTAETNKTFLDEQLKLRVSLGEQLLANKQYVDADREFASIVRDFHGLLDVEPAAQKSEQLSKSSEVKKEMNAEEDLYRRQLREAGEIRILWMKMPEPEMVQPPRLQAMAKLAEFRKAKEQPNDSRDRRLARRVLTQLTIEAFEMAQSSVRDNDYTTALANYELIKEVDPKNANVRYEIARIYALKRQKKPALQFLEEAVSLGFKDVMRLKADEAFSSLADEPRYQKLVSGLGAK